MTTSSVEEQLGLVDANETVQEEPRPVIELLKLNTFQGMSDEEIKSLITYCADMTAKQTAQTAEFQIKESLYYSAYLEAKERYQEIRNRRPHYAITNDGGEIVGYTDDTEEEE